MVYALVIISTTTNISTKLQNENFSLFVKALGDIYAGLSMYIKQLLEAVKYFSIIRVCKHKNQNLDEMI